MSHVLSNAFCLRYGSSALRGVSILAVILAVVLCAPAGAAQPALASRWRCPSGQVQETPGGPCCTPGPAWATGRCSRMPTACRAGEVEYAGDCHPAAECLGARCGPDCADGCEDLADKLRKAGTAESEARADEISRKLCAGGPATLRQRSCWYAPADRTRWSRSVAEKVERARAAYEDGDSSLPYVYATDYAWALEQAGDRRAAMTVLDEACSRWPDAISPCLQLAEFLAQPGPWQDRRRAAGLLAAGCARSQPYCDLLASSGLLREHRSAVAGLSRACYQEHSASACRLLVHHYGEPSSARNVTLATQALEALCRVEPSSAGCPGQSVAVGDSVAASN